MSAALGRDKEAQQAEHHEKASEPCSAVAREAPRLPHVAVLVPGDALEGRGARGPAAARAAARAPGRALLLAAAAAAAPQHRHQTSVPIHPRDGMLQPLQCQHSLEHSCRFFQDQGSETLAPAQGCQSWDHACPYLRRRRGSGGRLSLAWLAVRCRREARTGRAGRPRAARACPLCSPCPMASAQPAWFQLSKVISRAKCDAAQQDYHMMHVQ